MLRRQLIVAPGQLIKAVFRKSLTAQKVYRRLVIPLLPQSEPDLYIIRRCNFDMALDVGANVGTYAIELAKVSRNVVAFEPTHIAYEILKNVVPSNVSCFQVALGEADEHATIVIPIHDGRLESALATISSFAEGDAASQAIEIRSFDAGASQFICRSDANVDFVKIDVEGYELRALSGMKKTVQKFLPALLIEIEIRHNPSFDDVFSLLHSFGYSSFYSPDGVALVPCSSRDLRHLQTKERLDANSRQKSTGYSRGDERQYINNFWFVHPSTRPTSRIHSLIRRVDQS